MIELPDPLPTPLAEALSTVPLGRLGGTIRYYSTVGSTNDIAAGLAAEGQEGAIVIADAQTAGRGRRGHTWSSPAGAGLYVSIVLCPMRARHQPERATTLLTLTAGVALAEAVEQSTGLRADIKWPNDLLVGRRKLAGILAEGVLQPSASAVQSVVLGYGLNLSPASYPPELAQRVTSIESELGRQVDHAVVCAETIHAIAARYDDLLDAQYDAILDAWRARSPESRGARVSWLGAHGPHSGVTAGIDEVGALLVRVGPDQHRIVAGEVRWQDYER